MENPLLCLSFGLWASLAELQAVLADPAVRAALGQLLTLCNEATPGPYQVVLHIP